MRRYDSYKDSGVAWIGEIPEHWEIRSLRNFLSYVSIKGHGDKQLLSVTRENGVIVRNVESKEENHNFVPDDLSGYKLVEEGQFVINKMKSWQGSYGVSSYTGIVSPAYYVCNLRIENKRFFNIAIRSKSYVPFFTQYSKGIRVDQWDLSPIALKNIPFIVPPLDEQQNIVEFLDEKTTKIDTYIQEKEKEIRSLEELKQAEIAFAVTHGINPDVPMKNSGVAWIGEIPEHWDIFRLALAFIENRKLNLDLAITEAYQFNYGQLVPKKREYKEDEDADIYAKYTVLQPDDIVINGLNLNYDFVSQRVAIASHEGIITSAYVCLRPRVNVCSQYFCYLFKAMDSMKLFHGMGTGIRLTLSYSELKKRLITFPPLDEQQQIVEYIQ